MMRDRWAWAVMITITVVVTVTMAAMGEPTSNTPPAAAEVSPAAIQAAGGLMPHLIIDRERGWVDLEATVVMREGGWLELLACTPGTRTHESILTVAAKPSHVHLALMMLGLEQGQPMRWIREGEVSKVQPPRGPWVEVSLVTQKEGQPVVVPANQWILNKTTGQPMADPHWIFTGSFIYEHPDTPPYQADVTGSVISIVNFGDEVLARPTDRTSYNDEQAWGPHTDAIPALGTPVVLRLRPVDRHPPNPAASADPPPHPTTQSAISPDAGR